MSNRAPRDELMRKGLEAMAQHRQLTDNELAAYQECTKTPGVPGNLWRGVLYALAIEVAIALAIILLVKVL